ncbi:hypothetical protein DL769_005265 [Monosporascus sp. CRB-8-3]|nr:hypothetical protein DL769_005265 [Monosporascus sp. CRB-8-3]
MHLQNLVNLLAVCQVALATSRGTGVEDRDWDRALEQANSIVAKLTLGEKVGMVTGAPVNAGAGPVAGPLGRRPLGGRNWEGFSPDPYLTGVAMDVSIREIQRAGVQAVAKHFIGNEQETQRTRTDIGSNVVEGISSNIDDRTLHELYMWPFADSVRAGTSSVMCSYNRMNQTYACENSALLNDLLKERLGFRGYVMSDWYATHSGAKSANAGLDMEMPGPISLDQGRQSWFGPNLTQAISQGTLSMDRLNDMVRRVLAPYFLLGQDRNFPTTDPSTLPIFLNDFGVPPSALNVTEVPARDVRGNHAALIRKLGAAGTVLLKNVNGILPLKAPKNIGVFGNDAADWTDGMALSLTPHDVAHPARTPEWGFDIGTLDIGGGAGGTRHTRIVSPLEAVRQRAKTTEARVQYILNNRVLSANNFRGIYPTPEVCLVFIKTFSVENRDRLSFEADWNSTVVAILAAHYPGEETGHAIVDVLWGDYNPSAKLPYTIPARASDYDSPIVTAPRDLSPTGWQDDFNDGLLIDYRLFDARDITPLYEFGFGLSYTTFELDERLSVTGLVSKPVAVAAPAAPAEGEGAGNRPAIGGNPELYKPLLHASTRVTNTGRVAGATVVQLYVALPAGAAPPGTPKQVLRGFEKIDLKPGETRKIDFELVRRDVSYWDTMAQMWRIPSGLVELRVGFSSRDIKVTAQHLIL